MSEQPSEIPNDETANTSGVNPFAFSDEDANVAHEASSSAAPRLLPPKRRRRGPTAAYEANKRLLSQTASSGLAGEATLSNRGYSASPQGGEELPKPPKQ